MIHGTNTGRKPYLSLEEEKELVEFLLKCSKMGYGKTRGEVMKIVEATMQKKGMKIVAYPLDGGLPFVSVGHK